MTQSCKYFMCIIILSLVSLHPTFSRAEKKIVAALNTETIKNYPVKEVVFSKEKGLTIGLANIRNYIGIEKNEEKIVRVIDQLKKYHVDMILFPEFSLTGYFWSAKGRRDSEECWKYMNRGVLNKHMKWLKMHVKAKLDGTLKYIIFNAIRTNPATASKQGMKQKFLNSTYVIDKSFNCEDLQANEKTHIYDKTFLPGIENVYTTTPKKDFLVITNKNKHAYWDKIGVTTCYDMCFSQLYQEYSVVHNVQAVFQLASWRATGSGEYGKRSYNLVCKACETCAWKPCPVRDHYYYGFQWDLMISDRAASNQIWMIAVNAVGLQKTGGYQFWGGSGVWAPSGMKIVEASHKKEELIVVRNLPIKQGIVNEREKFDYENDFNKIYRSVSKSCCKASNCCSSGNCCGSFTRFE